MGSSHFLQKVFVVFFLSLVLILSSSAQTGTTSLRGTVADNSRAVVTGAKVTLLNSAQNFSREMITSATGEFEFLALPPGTYALTIEKEGFNKYEKPDLQLLVNVPSTLNVTLQVGSAITQVEVSAQSQTINTTDASLGVAFNENQVKQLPLESRNVPDLLTLQTGVVYNGDRPDINRDQDTRSGSVNGSHSDQSNVTVDGIPANPKGGYAFTSVLPVTLDSVQEFRVTTSNYGADEGTSSGAQVALVTKSGTNEIHGSAYEYNRNSYFSANDYFIKAAQLSSGDPNKPTHLNRNIFGSSLGGPIKKDRLFLFLNFEGYRDAEAISVVRTVPTAAFRDGVVQYLCPLLSNGQPDTGTCPGNTVQGISTASYTAQPGYFALGPADLTKMDKTDGPAGTPLGYNPVVIAYMQRPSGSSFRTMQPRATFRTPRVTASLLPPLPRKTGTSPSSITISLAMPSIASRLAPRSPTKIPMLRSPKPPSSRALPQRRRLSPSIRESSPVILPSSPQTSSIISDMASYAKAREILATPSNPGTIYPLFRRGLPTPLPSKGPRTISPMMFHGFMGSTPGNSVFSFLFCEILRRTSTTLLLLPMRIPSGS